jgi:hypothetical protein
MKKLLLAIIVLFSITANASDTSFVSVQYLASKSTSLQVVDAVTNGILSATFSGVTVQNNNPSVATVTVSNTKTITVSGLAAGSGTAVISCHVNYVDIGDGQSKSEDKIIVVSFTVLPAPPHGVKLSLPFN